MANQNKPMKDNSKNDNQRLSPSEIASIASSAVDSLVRVVQCFGEEHRKTAELNLEGERIRADLARDLSNQKNETIRRLGEYQVEIKRLAEETKRIQISADQDRYNHEECMQRMKDEHDREMAQIATIQALLQEAVMIRRMAFGYAQNGNPLINMDLLTQMNAEIVQLSRLIAPPERHMLK